MDLLVVRRFDLRSVMADPATKHELDTKGTPNSSRNILVVDDDDMVRSALVRTLNSAGYTVRDASSAKAALELLRTFQADIVLSDHLMPEMTGLELLKRVHDRHPDCLRIIVTGHAEMNVAIDAINHGEVYRFIPKPWDNTELKVMLHVAFEHLDLQREHRQLLAMVRTQAPLLEQLRKKAGERKAQAQGKDAETAA
jgi:DNA-binding NtrC family response regulator